MAPRAAPRPPRDASPDAPPRPRDLDALESLCRSSHLEPAPAAQPRDSPSSRADHVGAARMSSSWLEEFRAVEASFKSVSEGWRSSSDGIEKGDRNDSRVQDVEASLKSASEGKRSSLRPHVENGEERGARQPGAGLEDAKSLLEIAIAVPMRPSCSQRVGKEDETKQEADEVPLARTSEEMQRQIQKELRKLRELKQAEEDLRKEARAKALRLASEEQLLKKAQEAELSVSKRSDAALQELKDLWEQVYKSDALTRSIDVQLSQKVSSQLRNLIVESAAVRDSEPQRTAGVEDPLAVTLYVPVIFTPQLHLRRGQHGRNTFRMNEASTFGDLHNELQFWVANKPNEWEIFSPYHNKAWPLHWHIRHNLAKFADPEYAIEVRLVSTKRKRMAIKEKKVRQMSKLLHERDALEQHIAELRKSLHPLVGSKKHSRGAILSDVLMHAIYIFVLAVDISRRQNVIEKYALSSTVSGIIQDRVITTVTGQSANVLEIGTITDLWEWLQTALVDTLTTGVASSSPWPDDQLLSPGILGWYNELDGPLRLQQYRVAPESLQPLTFAYQGNYTNDYNYSRHLPSDNTASFDTAPFGPRFPGDERVGSQGFVHSSFLTDLPYPSDDSPVLPSGLTEGSVRSYPPHGYIRDVHAAKDYAAALQELRQNGWIDQYTAAVMVRFTLKPSNYAQSTSVKILFEFAPSGILHSSVLTASLPLEAFEDTEPGLAWVCNVFLLLIVVFIAWVPLVRGLEAIFSGKMSLLKGICGVKFVMYGLILATTLFRFSLIWTLNDASRELSRRAAQAIELAKAYGADSTAQLRYHFALQNWTAQGLDGQDTWDANAAEEWPQAWPGDWSQLTSTYTDLFEISQQQQHIVALSCVTLIFVLLSAFRAFQMVRHVQFLWDCLFGTSRMWVFCSFILLHLLLGWVVLLNTAFQSMDTFLNFYNSIIFVMRVAIGTLDIETYDEILRNHVVTGPTLVVFLTVSFELLVTSLFIAVFYDGLAAISDVERRIAVGQSQLQHLAEWADFSQVCYYLTRESVVQAPLVSISHDDVMPGVEARSVRNWVTTKLVGTKQFACKLYAEAAEMQREELTREARLLRAMSYKLRGSRDVQRAVSKSRKLRREKEALGTIDLMPWEVRRRQSEAEQRQSEAEAASGGIMRSIMPGSGRFISESGRLLTASGRIFSKSGRLFIGSGRSSVGSKGSGKSRRPQAQYVWFKENITRRADRSSAGEEKESSGDQATTDEEEEPGSGMGARTDGDVVAGSGANAGVVNLAPKPVTRAQFAFSKYRLKSSHFKEKDIRKADCPDTLQSSHCLLSSTTSLVSPRTMRDSQSRHVESTRSEG